MEDPEDNCEDVGTFAENNFYFQSADIAAIASLLYCLQDLVELVRVRISAEGLSISQKACRETVLIFVKFRADQFEEFHSDGKSIISFDPTLMYKLLSGYQQRDVMYWKFDKRKPEKLRLGVLRNGDDGLITEYVMPLHPCSKRVYVAPPEEVDYFLAFDTSVITNIISTMTNLGKDFESQWITIACDKEEVIFSNRSGHMCSKAEFCLRTAESKERSRHRNKEKKRRRSRRGNTVDSAVETEFTRKVVQERVVNKYYLQNLAQLQKCFSINRGFILMYVKRDYPIIFEVKVGTLGILKAVMLFCQDEEEVKDMDKIWELRAQEQSERDQDEEDMKALAQETDDDEEEEEEEGEVDNEEEED